MKRPLRRFEVAYLAAVLGGGVACTPDNSVKPGAPVLTNVAIVDSGKVTNIPAGAQACDAAVVAGGACYTTSPLCFQPTSAWCTCVAVPAPAAPMAGPDCGVGGTMGGAGGMDGGAAGAAGGAAGMDAGAAGAGGAAGAPATSDAAPPDGTWACDPFGPTAQVLFTFDRLLDTRPLDPGDGTTPVAAAMAFAGTTPIGSNADYAPNGSPNELIFGPYVLNDIRSAGPSLLISGAPAFPASSAITITLDPTMVRAKDGHTPFTDNGNFNNGSVSFLLGPFAATITAPQPPAPTDACAPANTLVALDATGTVTFTNKVDPAAAMAAISVTSNGTGVPFTAKSTDGLTFTIAPAGPDMKWPANATIKIAVDGAVADLAGDTLGTNVPQEQFFTTGAN
jgi:Bacterial Ig-like domain